MSTSDWELFYYKKLNKQIPNEEEFFNTDYWRDFNKKNTEIIQKGNTNVKCNKCEKTGFVYVEAKQMRSADEGMSQIYKCNNCGNVWRVR